VRLQEKLDTTQIFNPAPSRLTKAQFVVKKEAMPGLDGRHKAAFAAAVDMR
jgi:hypothetical protein